jgi:hypothetical protein
VVDKFGNDSLYNLYKSFPIVENNKLIDTLRFLLNDDNKRKEIAMDSYNELINQPDMKSYVKNSINNR